ncbi:MAG: peptidyl-prolyl cis-trans isomerase [Actinomycetota bacterium]
MPVPKDRRIVVALVLAATLVALLVGVAIAQGIGNPSVPSDDVAVVEDAPDSHITTAEFQASLEQAAALQGAKEVPPPDDPQYSALRDSAMADVLLGRWVRGEASELGVTVSDSEIESRLDQIIQQDFGGRKQFEQYLKQAHFTSEQARERIELQLLSDEIQKQVLPQDLGVSDSEIEDFYNANLAQFEQPETRDVRRILNKDQAKVEQAKALLEQDDSPASWKKVAARFSTEEPTKDSGGLVEGVGLGESEPVLEEQIFSAAEGQLVGPFKGQSDYYLIEVEKITPAETTPLSEVSEQIGQQLTQGKQQQISQNFQADFVEKWRSRSFCADDYVIDSCENFTPPRQTIPGAPPVVSTPAVPPGQATVFPGQPIPALPQGPYRPPVALQDSIIGPPGGVVPQGGAPAPPSTPPGG